MGIVRRKFGVEFKREAVSQATQPGNAVATVSRDLGVHESVLWHWVKKFGSGAVGKGTDQRDNNRPTSGGQFNPGAIQSHPSAVLQTG